MQFTFTFTHGGAFEVRGFTVEPPLARLLTPAEKAKPAFVNTCQISCGVDNEPTSPSLSSPTP